MIASATLDSIHRTWIHPLPVAARKQPGASPVLAANGKALLLIGINQYGTKCKARESAGGR